MIVELLMAALFTLLLTLYGVGIPWLAYAALACILLGASLVDLDTFTIPNGFVIAAVIVWLFMMVASFTGMVDWPLVPSGLRSFSASLATDSLVAGAAPEAAASVFGVGSMFVPLVGAGWQAAALDGLAGGVAIGGGILVFSLAFDAATGKTSLGGGDVKLLFAVGLFLGVAMSLFNLLIACVMGLVFAAIRLRRPQRAPSGEEAGGKSLAAKAIPFGPAIAAATMLTLLIGPTVLTWYVGLF